jgi:hypothetical protein
MQKEYEAKLVAYLPADQDVTIVLVDPDDFVAKDTFDTFCGALLSGGFGHLEYRDEKYGPTIYVEDPELFARIMESCE